MVEKILCVDDDANILESYRRLYRKHFHIDTAPGGEQGLATVKSHGPYAVVLTDLRMPRMDGIRFLSRVREIAPNTIRVMLSGNADFDAALAAVNEGHVFRFLTKPCPPAILIRTLEAALEQYRLVMAERDLLEKTLSGSVKVLTEILSLVNPGAFSKASRIKRHVQDMTRELGLSKGWQFELAAMLSQIGCITLPPDIPSKLDEGLPLSPQEQELFDRHPAIGKELLDNIPRLEVVASMIEKQHSRLGHAGSIQRQDPAELGGQMLRIALDYDRHLSCSHSPRSALAELRNHQDDYEPKLLLALESAVQSRLDAVSSSLTLSELGLGMILNENIRASTGVLLVPRGQEVTQTVLQRLQTVSASVGLIEPFEVLIPDAITTRPPVEEGSVHHAPQSPPGR